MVKPFSFLNSTLNVLIIEDDPLSLSITKSLLEPEEIFSVYTATTTSDALGLLRSGKRFHVCMMDLGINDTQNDEFCILRQYAQHSSILVLTGSVSPQKGATSIQLGARAVFEKGASFNCKQILDSIHYNTLINIVNPRYNQNNSDTINTATKILFEKRPESVTAWAEYLRITDRQLRNLWHTGSGFRAKYILYLYTLYSSAFNYYQNIRFESQLKAQEYLQSISEQKLANYFLSNQEAILFILS